MIPARIGRNPRTPTRPRSDDTPDWSSKWMQAVRKASLHQARHLQFGLAPTKLARNGRLASGDARNAWRPSKGEEGAMVRYALLGLAATILTMMPASARAQTKGSGRDIVSRS